MPNRAQQLCLSDKTFPGLPERVLGFYGHQSRPEELESERKSSVAMASPQDLTRTAGSNQSLIGENQFARLKEVLPSQEPSRSIDGCGDRSGLCGHQGRHDMGLRALMITESPQQEVRLLDDARLKNAPLFRIVRSEDLGIDLHGQGPQLRSAVPVIGAAYACTNLTRSDDHRRLGLFGIV